MDLLLARRSARQLAAPAPDDAAIELMLAAAMRAPDHGRLRPWRFVIIRNAARERLGALFARRLKARGGASPEALERERQKPMRAPLIIVVAASPSAQAKVPRSEQVLAAAAAAEHVMLTAQALGFGAMWKTGDAAYDPAVRAALGFGVDDEILGFLYVGTDPAPPPPRTALADWRACTREWSGDAD